MVLAQEGDREALEGLLQRHYDRIHAVCRRVTGNDSDADDATQEALLAVVRGLPRFSGQSRFSTWVYRVSVNTSLDEIRRRQRRPEPSELHEERSSSGPDVETGVGDRIDVDAALAHLPTDFRVAVVLRDLAGLDYAEIAEVLDVPIGTVRSRISRGRTALVPLLADPEARSSQARPGNSEPAAERPT